MATSTSIKTQVDLDITNKTTVASITPANVGSNIKSILDYVDQEITAVAIAGVPNAQEGVKGIASLASTVEVGQGTNGTNIVTPVKLKAVLDLKENLSNKSTATNLGGFTPNDVLYPTQKAVKTYIDASFSTLDNAIFDINQNVTDLNENKENSANKSNNITTDAASTSKYPSVKAIKDYADSLVVGLVDDRGNFTPSATSPGGYPLTGGSGVGGAIKKGDLWYIAVNGFLGTTAVTIGTSVRALVDNPLQVTANWNILNVGSGYTSENSTNKASTITVETTDVKYPSVKAIKTYVDGFASDLQDAISDINQDLLVKENASNKSPNVTLGGVSTSDALYPSQKAVKTYVDANSGFVALTTGYITGVSGNTAILTYGINSVYQTTGDTDKVILPETGIKIGQEIYVFCEDNIRIRGNIAGTAVISTGISTTVSSIDVFSGDRLRFIKTSSTAWTFEKIEGLPKSQQVIATQDGQPSVPSINNIKYVRLFTSSLGNAIKLTGSPTVGDEYYIKNPTSYRIVLRADNNINGNSSLDIEPGTHWHLIKEDNGTNSITAFQLSYGNTNSGATYIGVWDYTGATTYAVGDIVTTFTYDSSTNSTYQMWGTYICITVPSGNFNPGNSNDWVQLGLTKLATGTRLKGFGTANEPITLKGYKRVGYIYATGANAPQRSVNFFNGMDLPPGVTETFARVSTGSYELRYTALTGNTFVNNLGLDNFFNYSFGMNPDISYGGSFTTISGGNKTLVIGFQNKPAGVLTDGFSTVNYTIEWFE